MSTKINKVKKYIKQVSVVSTMVNEVLKEGERIIGSRTTKFTLVDYPTMDESSDRLKQEIKCMRFIDFHRILYTVEREIEKIKVAMMVL